MFTELKTHIPVECPKGTGYAFAIIDYGQEHHLLFVIVIDDTGEIWTVPNPDVRVRPNDSMRAKRKTEG